MYEEGTPKEIFEHPRKPNTIKFIKRLTSLTYKIETVDYDFTEAYDELQQYAEKLLIENERISDLQIALEEIVVNNIMEMTDEPQVLVRVDYSEKLDLLTLGIRYQGEHHDPKDSDNELFLEMLDEPTTDVLDQIVEPPFGIYNNLIQINFRSGSMKHMKNNRITKNYASILLVLFVIGLLLTGTLSTAYAAEYQTIADLNGKKIGVQTGCLYETHIADKCPDAEIQYFTMPQDMILALNSQKIDAYLIEEVGYYATAAAHPELAAMKESAGLCEASVIIGNNEKQEKLLAQVNEFIANHGSNGDGMLDEMYTYWVTDFDAETSKTEQGGFTGENGELTIACEGGYEPFSYVNEDGDSGYDVDFIFRFCREYGYTPNIQRVAFESIAPGAESGKYDIGMNIILSDESDADACLSDVYYSCDIFMVVPGQNDTDARFY